MRDDGKCWFLLCGLTSEQRQPNYHLWHDCGQRDGWERLGLRIVTGYRAESEGQVESGEEELTKASRAGPCKCSWDCGVCLAVGHTVCASCLQFHTLVLLL